MKRNRSFFKVDNNGQRWFVTCCEYGPYTDVEAAMAEADKLNKLQASTRKEQNRVVLEWRERKTQ